jgi:hypothetical protein
VQFGQVVGLDCGDPGVEAVAVAAGKHVTERGHMLGDRVEVMAAFVPALVQVIGEWVQDAGPAPEVRGDQQVLHIVGAGEAAHRFPGQAELTHDRLDTHALGEQRLDVLVTLSGAFDQPALFGSLLSGLGGELVEVKREPRRGRRGK